MYVDLEYTSRKPLPIGCTLVGGLVGDDDAQLRLVVDKAQGGRYVGLMHSGVRVVLDQAQVSAAVQAAELERASARPELLPAPLAREKMSPITVTLDPWTVSALRHYGNGNLSAGIRQAAKLLVGVV